MKISHRQRVIKKLGHLVSNLEEIKEKKVIVRIGWKNIDGDIDQIYDLFLKMLSHYIEGCNHLIKIIPNIPRIYWSNDLWDDLVDYQSQRAHYFRMFSLRFFPPPTVERLYNYLFIKDILRTFPENLELQKNLKFLVTYSNSIALFSIQDALLGLVDSIDTAIQTVSRVVEAEVNPPDREEILRQIRTIDAYAFECDPREKLSNKIILGHEIFHIIVKKNPEVGAMFSEGLNEGKFGEYFSDIERSGFNRDEIIEISHIEELFCDFGAAWHLGPCSGFAAIRELAFFGKASSPSHPPRSARIKIILNAYKYLRHPSITRLRNMVGIYKNEMNVIKDSSIKQISDFFATILENDLGIKKYYPPNEEEKLKRHIQHKTPFMYDKDIRLLFNNLPPMEEISGFGNKDFDEYLSESIRKNLMRLTFKRAMAKKMNRKAELELPEILYG